MARSVMIQTFCPIRSKATGRSSLPSEESGNQAVRIATQKFHARQYEQSADQGSSASGIEIRNKMQSRPEHGQKWARIDRVHALSCVLCNTRLFKDCRTPRMLEVAYLSVISVRIPSKAPPLW